MADEPAGRAADEFAAIAAQLHAFAQTRGWLPYHGPKNLSMSVAIEAGELMECFQWLTDDQAGELPHQPEKMAHVRGEMADVFIYLVHLADALGVDLLGAVREKIAINERRFSPTQDRRPCAQTREAPALPHA
jgi:NTP pyrophosphatase (non-canonical NTP hydrolase)